MSASLSSRSTISSMQVLHSSYFHPVLRSWTSPSSPLAVSHFMLPLFITNKPLTEPEPVASLPGVSRFTPSQAVDFLRPLVQKGLTSVLLFPVMSNEKAEDELNNAISNPNLNPVLALVPRLVKAFPDLLIGADVCLCAFTSHGHCAIMDETTATIDPEATLDALVEVAKALVLAGVRLLAPSDMMDGRVAAIKAMLRHIKLSNQVALMAYSAKFASCFYGPFRDAAGSAPAFGDRRSYQLPAPSMGLAMRAVDRDVAEGADLLMVKPGLAYLDVVRETKDRHPNHLLAIYQVSGEFAMLVHGARAGLFELKEALEEVVVAMRRAGADLIISYFVPSIIEWTNRDQ